MTRTSFALMAYPIGSIYMSASPTSPATIFGGTWERITGRFLLAATDGGSTGTDLQSTASVAAGGEGGEAAHTITSSETGQKALTITGGSHAHTTATKYNTVKAGTGSSTTYTLTHTGSKSANPDNSITVNTSASHTHTVGASNADSAHNNMPPFLAVYVWKRTA